jgi:hypothetical protein
MGWTPKRPLPPLTGGWVPADVAPEPMPPEKKQAPPEIKAPVPVAEVLCLDFDTHLSE